MLQHQQHPHNYPCNTFLFICLYPLLSFTVALPGTQTTETIRVTQWSSCAADTGSRRSRRPVNHSRRINPTNTASQLEGSGVTQSLIGGNLSARTGDPRYPFENVKTWFFPNVPSHRADRGGIWKPRGKYPTEIFPKVLGCRIPP